MKKYLSVFLVAILTLSLATCAFASQRFTTDVTLIVGGGSGETTGSGTGGENPDPGTGSEKPDPGMGDEKPDPGTGGEKPVPGTGSEKPDPGTGGEKPGPGTGSEKPDPGAGGENPDPGTGGEKPDPGTGGEKPDPGTGSEKPDPGASGEKPGFGTGSGKPGSSTGGNQKPNRPSGGKGRPNRPNGGSSSSSSKPSSPSKAPSVPTGTKSGGVDVKGKPYYLIDGVHVASGIHENGYMHGFSDRTFGPDSLLTRAQFAAIMDRVFKFDEASITKSFEDTRGHWAEESINRLASRGVILGVSSTEFRPNDGLTKGHVLLMLSRVLDIAEYSKVSDLASVEQYHAKEAIARMLNSGIYDEISPDFDVNARITRGEMVHLLNNIIYERNAKATRTEQVLENYQIFLDLIHNRWHMYYGDSVKSLDYNYLMREVANIER